MAIDQVLHMNGGMGDTSYARNSLLQRKVTSMTKPIYQKAITNLYCNILPTTLAIADLGCSSGPNTLFAVSEFIKVVQKLCKRLGHRGPEYQVFLNDLTGNDFNSILKSLSGFQEELNKQAGARIGPCFFTGVPGSFYGRLFPSNSLHFVHSSYSLMWLFQVALNSWLSQVPEGLEGNKWNIYMVSTSPPSVIKAYHDQFQKDFSLFLKCLSEEVIAGGSMVLTIEGRKNEDPCSKECCYIWELLAMALKEMVPEGLIEEEKLDSFNIPLYTPSPLEVKTQVEKEGSFKIDHLEVSKVNWNPYADELNLKDEFKDIGYNIAKSMRAATESLLVNHFGEAIIDEVFSRYKVIVVDHMGKEKTPVVNVVVSLTKRRTVVDMD